MFFTISYSQQYNIYKVPISTDTYDEFSPSFYNQGIIYVSNSRFHILWKYSTTFNFFLSNKEKKLDLFYTYQKDNKWIKEYLPIKLENAGPITYINNILYYTKEIDDHAGIFLRKNLYGIETSFPLNNSQYTIMHPTLNSKNDLIIFTSNIPGGYGKYDLYYSKINNNKWCIPINLGPNINTDSNEAFPFLFRDTILYYASNNPHLSKGGYDIFYCIFKNGECSPSKNFSELNTTFDDFGLILDETGELGYFSSNRDGSDDIYRINTNVNLQNIKTFEDKFCYILQDDSTNNEEMSYVWITGDGNKSYGNNVEYCYKKEGLYLVKLIKTNLTTNIFNTFEYSLNVEDKKPTISKIIKDKEITLKCTPNKKYNIKYYHWYLGDGTIETGPNIKHQYKKSGNYTIIIFLYSETEKMNFKFDIIIN